jgi:hypothetical protein
MAADRTWAAEAAGRPRPTTGARLGRTPLVLARPGTAARWAPVGLGVVLLVLAGFAVWPALTTP